MKMPDSTGFGDYCESGQVIPVSFQGEVGGYQHAMYLNDHAPIAGGRELWGFPKKLGCPELRVHKDTLVGTLDFNGIRIATGTMGYKASRRNNLIKCERCALKRDADCVHGRADRVEVPIACVGVG